MTNKIIYSEVQNVQDNNPEKKKISWSSFIQFFAEPEARGKMTLKKYLACKNNKERKSEADAQKNGTAIIPGKFGKPGTRSNVV